MIIQPMLAAKLTEKDLVKIKFPVIVSPKIDGIRVVCHNKLGPVTRKLKNVPNEYVRAALKQLCPLDLDGEIISGPHDTEVFNRTSSAIMSASGMPDFTYLVFDTVNIDPYLERNRYIKNLKLPRFAKVLESAWVDDLKELESFEREYLSRGFEGIMIRGVESAYKQGRSTINEQYLLKLKRFHDADATIIGYEERMQNNNPQTRDERGYAKRSSHKENKTPTGMLGAFICTSEEFPGVEFSIGTGLTEKHRIDLWTKRDKLIGKRLRFKYQSVGVKNAPRFPVFFGFRKD